ncbi:MAG: DUF1800 domain-containing protein [Chloroflexi bacterium]|nr:DUF1800 domain-containing protein [Chloroflexota bacterium]
MAGKDIALMAHLMRRAGFGATYEELEARAAKGYEATVEELLEPDANGVPEYDELTLARYFPDMEVPSAPALGTANFMYHLYTTPRPLVEKMTLFWHMLFATGNSKVDNPPEMLQQIEMFRQHGMGNYKELLMGVAKDPSMIFWLDNNQNHKLAPNENWGRELLELFSMGQGNYSEDDVKMTARAFTGWTILPKIPRTPYQRHHWKFIYKAEDHDNSEKTFLGHKGNFNGEDIIDIIVDQPATAQFMARHLYNYFVADEVQVPSWLDFPPRDPEAVNAIADTFVKSGFEIKDTLRFLFNSDFFKDESVWFAKVKNPAEVVAGTIRLIGDFKEPRPGVLPIGLEGAYQGQDLINPPSVEGWHTGREWVDTGSLVRRVNFVADSLSNADMPGVQAIINRLGSNDTLTPEQLVDGCLELLGAIRVEDGTRQQLVDHVKASGEIKRGSSEDEVRAFGQRVTEVLQLIAATREYQFG